MYSNLFAYSDTALWQLKKKDLVKLLDRVCRAVVIKRDKRCVICGSEFDLQQGHYIHRGSYGVRWDLQNNHAQCARCNNLHEHDTEPYTDVMICKYGAEVVDELRKKAGHHRRYGREELIEIYKGLHRTYSTIKAD